MMPWLIQVLFLSSCPISSFFSTLSADSCVAELAGCCSSSKIGGSEYWVMVSADPCTSDAWINFSCPGLLIVDNVESVGANWRESTRPSLLRGSSLDLV